MNINQKKVLGIYEYGGVPDESYILTTPENIELIIKELRKAKDKYIKEGINDLPISPSVFTDDSKTVIHFITFTEEIESESEQIENEKLSDKLLRWTIIGLLIMIPIFAIVGFVNFLNWIFH